MCAAHTDRPLAIINSHSPPIEGALYEPTVVLLHKNRGQFLAVAIIDGSTNSIHTFAVLQIQDKQQLEILVLLAYHVIHNSVYRHTTIVNNETFVNSSVGSL